MPNERLSPTLDRTTPEKQNFAGRLRGNAAFLASNYAELSPAEAQVIVRALESAADHIEAYMDTIESPESVAAKATMTCSGMPNQFEGIVDGRAFYYRARWGHWSLTLAHPGYGQDDIVDHGDVVAEGVRPNAGWWQEPEARAALAEAIATYRNQL